MLATIVIRNEAVAILMFAASGLSPPSRSHSDCRPAALAKAQEAHRQAMLGPLCRYAAPPVAHHQTYSSDFCLGCVLRTPRNTHLCLLCPT